MTPTAIAETRSFWCAISDGWPLYLVAKKGEFLCEGPYERLDLPQSEVDDDTESCIRVFSNQSDANIYCREWRELLGVGPDNKDLRVVRAHIRDIWTHLHEMVANSLADYFVPPRIEACTLDGTGAPRSIDTLFTEREEMN